jgi:phosphatidate cytidylyltransferase
MSNLALRAISGTVYVALIVLGAFFIPDGSYFLAALLGGLALSEWQFFQKSAKANLSIFLSVGLLLAVLLSSPPFTVLPSIQGAILSTVVFTGVLSLGLTLLFQHSKDSKPKEELLHSFFGLIYIIPALWCMAQLGSEPWLLLGVFIMVWCFDSFAYLSGKYLGKHKLMPRISPNKTWEGFIGGGLFSALAALLLGLYSTVTSLSIGQWLLLSVLVVISSTLGDLFESGLKRQHGIKDSGKMMPGHGGILDRIDSLLFAMPMAWIYIELIKELSV